MKCRRDMGFDEEHVAETQRIHEECKQEHGSLSTQVEYRMSFQLKIYEMVQKGRHELAAKLSDVYNWHFESSAKRTAWPLVSI